MCLVQQVHIDGQQQQQQPHVPPQQQPTAPLQQCIAAPHQPPRFGAFQQWHHRLAAPAAAYAAHAVPQQQV